MTGQYTGRVVELERGTEVCNSETAAMLLTLGFVFSRDTLLAIEGDSKFSGQRSWGFLQPQLPIGYDINEVLDLPRHPARLSGAIGWIRAGYLNQRLMLDHLRYQTPLQLVPLTEGRWIFDRRGTHEALQGRPAAAGLTAGEYAEYATGHLALAAALATLGFEPLSEDGDNTLRIASGRICHAWRFGPRNRTGELERDRVIALWDNDHYMGQPSNTAPLAVLGDAFYNLQWCRNCWSRAHTVVQVMHGDRTVLIDKAANDEDWQRAEEFLTR